LIAQDIGLELSVARLIKFLAEFNRSFGIDGKKMKKQLLPDCIDKNTISIPNLNMEGQPLASIGLLIKFKNEPNLANKLLGFHETGDFLKKLKNYRRLKRQMTGTSATVIRRAA